MAYSTQRATSDGTLLVLPLAIEFFDQPDIHVFIDEIPQVVDVGYEWLTSNSIRFLVDGVPTPVSNGLEVLLRRETDKSEPRHIFDRGSPFNYSTLDEDFRQVLYIAQEAIEGSNVGDIYTTLNMHGNRILNIGLAIDDGDAVSLGQYRADALGASQARVQAQAARDRAITAENRAVAAGDAAVASIPLSKAEADRAKLEADRSAAAAAAIGDNVALAQTARAGAEAARDTSRDYRDAAAERANEAGNSASQAGAEADRAEQMATALETASLQLGMSAWGYRPNPFKGYAPDDGQELDRSVYPDFAAALDAGLLPVTSEAIWQTTPGMRGHFVANSSTGKFRMRDLNGGQVGSIAGVFQRGGSSAAPAVVGASSGQINIPLNLAQTNQALAGRNMSSKTYLSAGVPTTAADSWSSITGGPTGYPVENHVFSLNPGAEPAPAHASGCWMTRLYGIATPLGAAEASSLATAYASLSARVSMLEARATLTQSSVVSRSTDWESLSIVIGSTWSFPNPFGNRQVHRASQILRCVTTDLGYAPGDVVCVNDTVYSTTGSRASGTVITSLNANTNWSDVSLRLGASPPALPNKSTGITGPVTAARWQVSYVLEAVV